MTVEQFDPQAPKKSSNSNESPTTTLDIPAKMIEENITRLLLQLMQAKNQIALQR